MVPWNFVINEFCCTVKITISWQNKNIVFCSTCKNVYHKLRWKFRCRVFWLIWTKLNTCIHAHVLENLKNFNWWLDLWNAIREINNQIIKGKLQELRKEYKNSPRCELLPHMVVESLEVKGEAMLASPSFTIWAFSSSSISFIMLANFFYKTKYCL